MVGLRAQMERQVLIGIIQILETRPDGYFSHFQGFPVEHATFSSVFVQSVLVHSGSAYQKCLFIDDRHVGDKFHSRRFVILSL